MTHEHISVTYIGGPTALVQWGGLRLLTDPTLDPAESAYPAPHYTLHKTQSPAIGAQALGPIDVVLLSHDHHFDNLDHSGRDVLARAGLVLTTVAGAERVGGGAIGMEPWQTREVAAPDGGVLRITATPARHGPVGGDRGPVVGFALAWAETPRRAVYVSGDTVWYEGVAQVAERFDVRVAALFLGAARVAVAGPSHLTMTATEAVEAARAFGNAPIVPLHFEGWAHFSESRAEVEEAFASAGMAGRVRWLEPGVATAFEV